MFKLYDGAKSISLDSDVGWNQIAGYSSQYSLDSFNHEGLAAYNKVPVMRRLVDMRAGAIASIPFTVTTGGKELELPSRDHPWLSNLRSFIRQTECSLLIFGSSYALKEENKFGLNKQLRWVSPLSVYPQYDTNVGLKGFKRVVGSTQYDYNTEDIFYVWEPNLALDVGPGVPPVMTAIVAARVLNGVAMYADSYFKRGAIKATLLQVDGNPQQSELAKLEKWWKNMVSGIQNAFNSVAIKASVNPLVIGDGIGELGDMQLVLQYQREICAALGVAPSMTSDEAANFAVSNQDTINTWTLTFIPRAQAMQDELNRQYFYNQDMELLFNFDGVEALQEAQLNQSRAAAELYTSCILKKNEVREIIGYEPDDEGNVFSDGNKVAMQPPDKTESTPDEGVPDEITPDDEDVGAAE